MIMTFPSMLCSMVMVALYVLSSDMSVINSRFCADNLHSSIAKSINTSPYKDASPKKTPSEKSRRGDKKTLGFIREMDIVNGFQLCEQQYRGVSTRGETPFLC